jgi:hypothetical protein
MKLSSRLFFQLNENVNVFQRKFVNEVRRCDEMERKLRYIEAEVKKDNVTIPDVHELPKAPNPREIIDLEVLLSVLNNQLLNLLLGAFGEDRRRHQRTVRECGQLEIQLSGVDRIEARLGEDSGFF